MKVGNSVSDTLGLTYLYNFQVGMSGRALKIGTWSPEEKFGLETTYQEFVSM